MVPESRSLGILIRARARALGCVARIWILTDHVTHETIRQADGGAAFPPETQIAERSWKAGRIT